MQLGFTHLTCRGELPSSICGRISGKMGRGDHRGFVYAEEGATTERRLVKNAYLEEENDGKATILEKVC